jgi:hypothetical protein
MKKLFWCLLIISVIFSTYSAKTESSSKESASESDCKLNREKNIYENCTIESIEATAMSQIVRDFFAPRNEQFDIIVNGKKVHGLSDIANGLMKSTNFPANVINNNSSNKKGFKLKQSAISFFNDFNSFLT